MSNEAPRATGFAEIFDTLAACDSLQLEITIAAALIHNSNDRDAAAHALIIAGIEYLRRTKGDAIARAACREHLKRLQER